MSLSVSSFPTGGLDGVYFLEATPSPNITGVPSDVLGAVITANRGPVNTAQLLATPADLVNNFGNLSVGLNGYLDVLIAMQQGASQIWVSRVISDGTFPASFTLNNASAAAEIYLEAVTPGSWGNSLNVAVANGSQSGTTKLTVTNSTTQEVNVFDNLVLTTLSGIAAAITVINNSSTLLRARLPVVANPVTVPTLATAASGGTVPNGQYFFATAWYNLQGQTLLSPETSIVTTGTNISTVTVTPGDAKPAGAVGYMIYCGTASGLKSYVTSTTGVGSTILTLASQVAGGGAVAPTTNSATLISGTVAGVTVTAAGTSYTSVPTVVFSGGGGGSGAAATAVLSGSTVAYIYMTSVGSGYTSAPTVAISGGGGSGATATATFTPITTGAPTPAATNPFTGGVTTAVPSAALLGGSGASNTGVYALAGLSPAPFAVFCGTIPKKVGQTSTAPSGGDDSNLWAGFLAAAQANSWIAVLTAPQGTSPTAVQTLTAGLDTDYGVFVYPWQNYFESTVYQATILTSPLGYYAGEVATIAPNVSPGNKPIVGQSSPEFVLSPAQMTALISPAVRVVPVGQVIPSGGLGIASGYNLSTQSSLNQVYRRRMATFIERSAQPVMGQFVDNPITPGLFSSITNVFNAFLSTLASDGLIGDYTGSTPGYAVYCTTSNNPPSSVQQGIVNCVLQIILFSAAQQIQITLQIGQGVVITQS